MLKIILTTALLISCVPPNGAKFLLGQPKYLDCLEGMNFDLRNKLSTAIELEFKATATGTHTIRWQEDFDTNGRYHIIAESAMKLLLQLTTCQRVYNILAEVTTATVCTNSTLEEMAKLYFEKVDSFLQNDALVQKGYERIKSNVKDEGGFSNTHFENAKNQSHFPAEAGDRSSYNFFIFKQNSIGKMIVLHTYFVYLYDSSKYTRFRMTGQDEFRTSLAIVELSEDPECGDKVQRIYNETIVEVAETLNGMIKENASKSKDDFLPGISEKSTSSIFFNCLNANFQKSDLAVKFDLMKKKIQSVETRINEFSSHLGQAPTSVIGTTLAFEIAANSVGTHFFQINEDLNADKRSHVIGESVLKLLMQYSTFDKVFELLMDFTNTVTYTALYAEKVDRLFENDPSLGQQYKEIKRGTENGTALTADHFDKAKIPFSIFGNEKELSRFFYSLIQQNKLAKIAFLNLLFIGEWKKFGLPATNNEKNATANAIVKLSKNPKYTDKVVQLYNEAISIVNENLDFLMQDRDASQMEKIMVAVSDVLFKSLSITFQKDPNLAAEFEITKMIYEAGTKSGRK